MSKSELAADACIFFSDSPVDISRKVSRAVTDNLEGISYDPISRPGISSLIYLMSILSNISIESLANSYSQTKEFGAFKRDIAELVNQLVGPIRERYLYFMNNLELVVNILEEGEKYAREIAAENYVTIRNQLFS